VIANVGDHKKAPNLDDVLGAVRTIRSKWITDVALKLCCTSCLNLRLDWMRTT
jgi:hypothetical protein